MGKQLIRVAYLLSLLNLLVIAIAFGKCYMLTFQMTWVGVFRAARVKVALTSVKIDKKALSAFDLFLGKRRRKTRLPGDEEPYSLAAFQQTVCVEPSRALVPQICEGVKAAFVLGWVFVIVLGLDIVLMGFANWLRHDYARYQRKRSRHWAVILDGMGAGVVTLVLMLYTTCAAGPLMDLDYTDNAFSIVLQTTNGFPLDIGFFMLCFSPLLQLTVALVTMAAKYGVECTVDELRLILKEALEVRLQTKFLQMVASTAEGFASAAIEMPITAPCAPAALPAQVTQVDMLAAPGLEAGLTAAPVLVQALVLAPAPAPVAPAVATVPGIPAAAAAAPPLEGCEASRAAWGSGGPNF